MKTLALFFALVALQAGAQGWYNIRGIQLTPAQFAAVHARERLNYLADGSPVDGTRAVRVVGSVQQIVGTSGVLVKTRDGIVAMRALRGTDHINEGDPIEGVFVRDGKFDYTTVLGAAKRVPLYTPVACISAQTLLARMQSGQIAVDLSDFIPKPAQTQKQHFGIAPAKPR